MRNKKQKKWKCYKEKNYLNQDWIRQISNLGSQGLFTLDLNVLARL